MRSHPARKQIPLPVRSFFTVFRASMAISLNKPKLDNLAGDIWKSAERLRGKSMAERVRLIPRQRAATPDEMAETLVWFGSEANATITGQVIAAAGGE